MNEEFVEINGYKGKYKINRQGVVLSSRGRPLFQRVDRYGYKRVLLCGQGNQKNFLVHRLVCIAFLPNPENKPQVNHKNRKRWDNRLENLEWCTTRENINHSFANGRVGKSLKGECAVHHILKEWQIPEIRKRLSQGETLKSVGDSYGVSLHTIYSIKSGKNWNHV